MARRRGERGLTYIELVLVAALVSVMALVAVPFVHHRHRALKELELRRSLAEIRAAIDRFHDYAALGQVEPWDLDWNHYPKDLQMLVDGVEVRTALEQPPAVVRFLRRIPVDPMTGRAEWGCRGYADDPGTSSYSCDDLYDVSSLSQELALDGTPYSSW